MNQEQEILKRWIALEDGPGMDMASKKVKQLGVVGVGLTSLIVLSIYYQFHPAIVAMFSVVLGWLVAERNALRTRINMWPPLQKYLNWKLIHENTK